MEVVLRAAVKESLQAYLHDNAIFLAERLWGEFRTLENLHLVAHCHITAGDYETAFRLLQAHYANFGDIPPTSAEPVPSASGRRSMFKPMLVAKSPQWECTYAYAVAAIKTQRYVEAEPALKTLNPESNATVSYWLGIVNRRLNRQSTNGVSPAANYFNQSVQVNPMLFCAFEASARYYKAAENVYERAAAEAIRPPTPPAVDAPAPRASGAAARPVPSSATSPAKPLQQQLHGAAVNDGTSSSASGFRLGRQDAIGLLSYFAKAYQLLYAYHCNAAIEFMESPQMPQRHSGWVLEHLALAHFHFGDLAKSVEAFEAMQQREPWRLAQESLVCYSTALWHLKLEVKLGALAQRMIQAHPKSPYTLCVVGNCHSLGKDSESALLMFTRAARVSPPDFAYVHTLRGHEALSLEQDVVADTAFRAAIAADARHYSAIAGLGDLYLRIDDVTRARRQLRCALEINELPTIMNRYAATFHRPGQPVTDDLHEAVRLYDLALQSHPRNFAATHQRATVLLRLGFVADAMAQLERLLSEYGDEAAVHLTLGHCHAQQGDVIRAVASYRRAVELDARRAPYANGCIERLHAAAAASAAPKGAAAPHQHQHHHHHHHAGQ